MADGKLDWIGNPDEPQAAAGYINARADDADGIMLVIKNKDSSYSFRAFGDFKMSDAATAGALMSYQAAKQLYEGYED